MEHGCNFYGRIVDFNKFATSTSKVGTGLISKVGEPRLTMISPSIEARRHESQIQEYFEEYKFGDPTHRFFGFHGRTYGETHARRNHFLDSAAIPTTKNP